MSVRFQSRRGNGRFTRNTLENTCGLHANVHEHKADGSWCGGMNPTRVGEPPPTACGHCGEALRPPPATDRHEWKRPGERQGLAVNLEGLELQMTDGAWSDTMPAFGHDLDIIQELLRLAAEAEELRLTVHARDATLAMTVARLGGEVEGRPTARVNFLQRVDALRAIEAERDRLRPLLEQCEATVQAQLHLNQRLREPDGEASALLGDLLAGLKETLKRPE